MDKSTKYRGKYNNIRKNGSHNRLNQSSSSNSSKVWGKKANDIEEALKLQRQQSAVSTNDPSVTIINEKRDEEMEAVNVIPGYSFNPQTKRYYKSIKLKKSRNPHVQATNSSNKVLKLHKHHHISHEPVESNPRLSLSYHMKLNRSVLNSLIYREYHPYHHISNNVYKHLQCDRLKLSFIDCPYNIIYFSHLQHHLSINPSYLMVGNSLGQFTLSSKSSAYNDWISCLPSIRPHHTIKQQSLCPRIVGTNPDPIIGMLMLDERGNQMSVVLNICILDCSNLEHNVRLQYANVHQLSSITLPAQPNPITSQFSWAIDGQSCYICQNNHILIYDINHNSSSHSLQRITIDPNNPRHDQNPVTTYHHAGGSSYGFAGTRNGTIYRIDTRMNKSDKKVASIRYCVDHIDTLSSMSNKLLCQDISGAIQLFDLRRADKAFKQIKDGDHLHKRSKKFWISENEEVLISSYESSSTHDGRIAYRLGAWDLTDPTHEGSKPIAVKSYPANPTQMHDNTRLHASVGDNDSDATYVRLACDPRERGVGSSNDPWHGLVGLGINAGGTEPPVIIQGRECQYDDKG